MVAGKIRAISERRTLAKMPAAHRVDHRGAFVTARSELRKVLFLALSVTFLFVYEISLEAPNGFAPNSHGRRVWSLARTNLNVNVKDQGYQEKHGIFRPGRRPACRLFLVKHLRPLV